MVSEQQNQLSRTERRRRKTRANRIKLISGILVLWLVGVGSFYAISKNYGQKQVATEHKSLLQLSKKDAQENNADNESKDSSSSANSSAGFASTTTTRTASTNTNANTSTANNQTTAAQQAISNAVDGAGAAGLNATALNKINQTSNAQKNQEILNTQAGKLPGQGNVNTGGGASQTGAWGNFAPTN